MKALIFNSGTGSRMGELTANAPKCMSLIGDKTIIEIQLRQLENLVDEVIITTGPFEDILSAHIDKLNIKIPLRYVKNSVYDSTNYIYSMYCAREFLNDDFIILHGDLVMSTDVLKKLTARKTSSVAIERDMPLPEKDFKAVIKDGMIAAIGVEFFSADAVACQPAYKFLSADLKIWLDEVARFCEDGNTKVYAENALNNVTGKIKILPFELSGALCREVDCPQDLEEVAQAYLTLEEK